MASLTPSIPWLLCYSSVCKTIWFWSLTNNSHFLAGKYIIGIIIKINLPLFFESNRIFFFFINVCTWRMWLFSPLWCKCMFLHGNKLFLYMHGIMNIASWILFIFSFPETYTSHFLTHSLFKSRFLVYYFFYKSQWCNCFISEMDYYTLYWIIFWV